MKRSKGRCDANQPLIDRTAEILGAGIIPCSPYPNLGFDRIYLWAGMSYITEIKNPKLKNPFKELTKVEAKRMEQLSKHYIEYVVVQTPEDLLNALGASEEDRVSVLEQLEKENLL